MVRCELCGMWFDPAGIELHLIEDHRQLAPHRYIPGNGAHPVCVYAGCGQHPDHSIHNTGDPT